MVHFSIKDFIKNLKSDPRLSFYADTPDGQKNKLFTFKVKSLTHAVDLATKFIQENGFKIRAAYYSGYIGVSDRIDKIFDLKTRQNSKINKYDIERQLDIVKKDVEFNRDEYILNNFPDKY